MIDTEFHEDPENRKLLWAPGSAPSEVNDRARAMMMVNGEAKNIEASAAPRSDLDVVRGQRRWAWVAGDEIKSVGYFETDPNKMDEQRELKRTWLPVSHFDSAPFDLALHWRLKPVTTIEGDHVRVEYPVVVKSLEHA